MPKKEQELPRQMHLEQAHPEGYMGYWNIPNTNFQIKPEDSAQDPERRIHEKSNHYKMTKLMRQDIAHEYRERLKRLGISDANTKFWLRAEMKRDIEKLINLGVWPLVVGNLTMEERILIHEVTNFPSPIRDLDSSEGFTIYPSEASWVVDIYGDE